MGNTWTGLEQTGRKQVNITKPKKQEKCYTKSLLTAGIVCFIQKKKNCINANFAPSHAGLDPFASRKITFRGKIWALSFLGSSCK